MAADYKKILEDLKKKSKGSFGDIDYMDLEDGDNILRFLPGHPNMEAFFFEVYYHSKKQNGKNMMVICLNHGDPDAGVCEICPSLEALRLSKDKSDVKLYKSQKAKPRYFSNVIDRSDDKRKALGFGITILKGYLAYVTDEEYGDVLHLVDGRDMTIVKSGKEMETDYDVKPKPKTSPVFADRKAIAALVGKTADDTQLYDLTTLRDQFKDEPEKALQVWEQGWDSLKDDDKKDDKGEQPASKKPTSSVSPVSAVAAMTAAKKAVEGCPKLKTRCSVCGENRFKTPTGNVCANGHGGAPVLPEGERPSAPSRAYLKEFPEPVEEAEAEAEEEEAESAEDVVEPPAKPAPASKKPVPAKTSAADEGLDDLDAILAQHSNKKK